MTAPSTVGRPARQRPGGARRPDRLRDATRSGQVLTLDGICAEHARVPQRRPRGDPGAGVDGHGRVPPPGRHHDPAAAQLERLRPAGDPLAPRRRRPHRAAALALRAAPRHRAGGRRAGRPSAPTRTTAGSSPRRSPTWWFTAATATSTPTCWPTRSSTARCSRPAATRCSARSTAWWRRSSAAGPTTA